MAGGAVRGLTLVFEFVVNDAELRLLASAAACRTALLTGLGGDVDMLRAKVANSPHSTCGVRWRSTGKQKREKRHWTKITLSVLNAARHLRNRNLPKKNFVAVCIP